MQRKVKFFKRFIDFLMSHLFIIIGFIVFIVLYSHKRYFLSIIIKLFGDISAYNSDLISSLASTLIAASISLLLSKIECLKKLIPHIKSNVYIILLSWYEKNNNRFLHWIIPKFIKLFYSYERFTLAKQQQITDNILDILMRTPDPERKKVFWIIGDAYSGKTSAVLNLFTDLITKSCYHNLFVNVDGHIEYYDFGRDDCDVQTFCDNYRNGKYKNNIIIIDNIHKIIQDSGIRSINNIARNFNAFGVIILMRPPKDFIIQKEIVDAFEKTIQEEGYSFNLKKIDYCDYDKEKDFWAFAEEHGLDISSQNGTILFHFVKMFIKGKGETQLISNIASFLNKEKDTELSLLLRYIISSSIFTGSFNVKLVIKEIQSENQRYNVRKYLRELYNIGFLNSYPNEDTTYFFFHEDLAKFYFSKTYPGGEIAYNRIIRKLYDYYKQKGNIYSAYLYSFLIQEQIPNKKLFEEVIINVNYRTILGELKYLLNLKPGLEKSYHKELGILYDRNGELQNAQKEYTAYYTECTPALKSDAFFKIVQSNHPYFAAHKDEAARYLNSPDLYSKLLAEYWIIHMNMHYGIFEFSRMEKLLRQFETFIRELIAEHPYDSLHLMRRCFFDYFRLYYISGICDYKRLSALSCIGIHNELNRCLEEYQAYYNKFIYGHYLLYEVLFRKGIFQENISRDEFQVVFSNAPEIKYDDVTTKEGIINYSLIFYGKAYDFMYKVGDKTYYFVNCRYMEAKAAAGDYDEPYIFYSNFKAYANQEQIVYYQACAEMYLFKLEFIHLFSEKCLLCQNATYYQEKLKETEEHLINAERYYREADVCPLNEYAEAMLSLYQTLFYYYTEKKNTQYIRNRLKRLEKICHDKNYMRELRIIKFISKNDYSLAPHMVKEIISYYPIVAQ